MSTTQSSTPGAEILPGVPHYKTSGFANTWAAYDALSEADGWVESYPDPAGAPSSRWKRGTVDGRLLVVYAPLNKVDEDPS